MYIIKFTNARTHILKHNYDQLNRLFEQYSWQMIQLGLDKSDLGDHLQILLVRYI